MKSFIIISHQISYVLRALKRDLPEAGYDVLVDHSMQARVWFVYVDMRRNVLKNGKCLLCVHAPQYMAQLESSAPDLMRSHVTGFGYIKYIFFLRDQHTHKKHNYAQKKN